jgi:hypothetical protein
MTTPRTLKEGHKYTNWLTDEAVEQALKDALPKRVSLHFVDYRDTADHCHDVYQETLEIDFMDPNTSVYDALDSIIDDDWLMRSQGDAVDYLTKQHIRPALESLLASTDIPEEYISAEIDEIVDTARELIEEECQERDDSTPLTDILRNTSDQYIVGQLRSDEGGLSWHEIHASGPITYDGYLKIVIDVLQLNPAVVKVGMKREGWAVRGRWPDRPNRKPYVEYGSLTEELSNITSNCNELTFLGLLDVSDLPNYKGKVLFPKGNSVGLFDRQCGGGSILGMELLRDFEFVQNACYRGNSFDKFRLRMDASIHYGVQETYGLTREGWGSTISMLS